MPYYPSTDAEKQAGVEPADSQYKPGDIRRYGSTSASDNTVAIGDALLVREAMYVPTGTWECDGEECKPNQYVYGAGKDRSVLRHTKNAKHSMLSMIRGGTIRDLTLDGDFQIPRGSNLAILELGGHSVTAERIQVKNVSRFGIRMRDYIDANISHSSFEDALGHGGSPGEGQFFIYNVGNLTNSSSCLTISFCDFNDTPKKPVERGPGGVYIAQASAAAAVRILFSNFRNMGMSTAGNFTASIDLYTNADGSLLLGNKIWGYIYFGIKMGGSGDVSCIGNTVYSAIDNNQLQAFSLQPNGKTSDVKRRFIVALNRSLSAAGAGFAFSGNSQLGNLTELLVANNQCYNAGLNHNASTRDAYFLDRCTNWQFVGNLAQASAGSGIRSGLSGGIASVYGNDLIDCKDAAMRTTEEDSQVEISISGNRSKNCAGRSQWILRNLKRLNFTNNVVLHSSGNGKVGVEIENIAQRLDVGPNQVDISNGSNWKVVQGHLADSAYFLSPESGVPYQHAGSPVGIKTPAYVHQVCTDTNSNDIYMSFGLTPWAWKRISA